MLKQLFLIITLIISGLFILQLQAKTTSSTLQFSKQSLVFKGEFSIKVPIETNNPVTLFVIETEYLDMNSIRLTLPDGTFINPVNQQLQNITTTKYSPKPGNSGGLSIKLNSPQIGLYIVTGAVSELTSVAIIIGEDRPSIHYKLSVGNSKKSYQAHEDIPLTLQLFKKDQKISSANVALTIVKNKKLLHKYSFKENKGIYTSTFTPDKIGDYELIVEVSMHDGKEKLTGYIVEAINVNTAKFGILDKPITYLIDSNADSYADELMLEFPTFGSLPVDGTFYIHSVIELGDEVLEDFRTIDAIEGRVYAKFSGKELREAGVSGPITIKRFQLLHDHKFIDRFEDLTTRESFKNDTWARDNLILQGDFTDQAVDKDGDGLFDAINVSFTVDCLNPGDYAVSVYLLPDGAQKSELFGSPTYKLEKGINTVNVAIHPGNLLTPGKINKLRYNHVFIYPNFKIDMNNNSSTLMQDLVQPMNSYHCDDFDSCEKPKIEAISDKKTL